MPRYKKRPVVIEAMRWIGTRESASSIVDWAATGQDRYVYPVKYAPAQDAYNDGEKACDANPAKLVIDTLEGLMTASAGDFIIKGVNGEFYPCKPDIFEKSYELVEE